MSTDTCSALSPGQGLYFRLALFKPLAPGGPCGSPGPPSVGPRPPAPTSDALERCLPRRSHQPSDEASSRRPAAGATVSGTTVTGGDRPGGGVGAQPRPAGRWRPSLQPLGAGAVTALHGAGAMTFLLARPAVGGPRGAVTFKEGRGIPRGGWGAGGEECATQRGKLDFSLSS